MQPRRETSWSSGSTVFQVMKRGAAVGGASGREDVDVAGVESPPVAESDVDDEEDEDEDEASSATRRRRAGFKGALAEVPLLALYVAQDDWICSRERGLRLLSSASRASKHTIQCSAVAMLRLERGDTEKVKWKESGGER